MTIDGYSPNCVETYTGVLFDILDPKPKDVRLMDIAWSLAHICRYNGHCHHHYSVAEHSLHVAAVVDDPLAYKAALLHDAAEAYVGDITRPVRKHIPEFHRIERRILDIIYHKFGVPLDNWRIEESVARADNAVLKAEAAVMMHSKGAHWEWSSDFAPAPINVMFYSAVEAFSRFRAAVDNS